jgi:hypothetical protein
MIFMAQTQHKRETYQSPRETYNLDPSKLSKIIAKIANYLSDQTLKQEIKNPGYSLLHQNFFVGNEKTLKLSTDVDKNGTIESFFLAELILGDHDSSLTLEIYNHPSLLIDPKELTNIGEEYSLK